MDGRLEKEIAAKKAMEKRLSELPDIFTHFYEWMDARDKSYTTMANYIRHTVEFMNFICKKRNNAEFYKDITARDIERYMTSIRTKEVSDKVVMVGDDIRAAKWSSLNAFFIFLFKKGYIENNPMLDIERPQIKTEHDVTYLTQDEIKSIFDRITTEGRPMTKNRDICIVALCLATALRVSAVSNINVEDIDFKQNVIRVVEKGRKIRNISFADNLRQLLLVWLKDRELYFNGQSSGPLFISQAKQRLTTRSIQHLVKKYTDHLSKKITPHKLRSSAAMQLRGFGMDVVTIASILGHNNITTTQRYIKAYDEDKKKAAQALDTLF